MTFIKERLGASVPPEYGEGRPFIGNNVIVKIGGKSFIIGESGDLQSVSVEQNTKGGGLAKLKFNRNIYPRVGAPVQVFLGSSPFWAGFVINSDLDTWQAEPSHGHLKQIIFWDEAYAEFSFAGTVRELVDIAFNYAAANIAGFKKGDNFASIDLVEFDINGVTIADILDFALENSPNPNFVWGVDGAFIMYFRSLDITQPIRIDNSLYTNELSVKSESDNIATVLSVFKNYEQKVVNESGEIDEIYPIEFLGKVGAGIDPKTKYFFPPSKYFFRYGHKEEKYEIDAPDMSKDIALNEAYRVLLGKRPTESAELDSYQYITKPVNSGQTVRIISDHGTNLSMAIELGDKAVKPSSINSIVFTADSTTTNEGYQRSDSLSYVLHDSPDWQEKVSLVRKIKRVVVGFSSSLPGIIILRSNGREYVNRILSSSFTQYIDINVADDFNKYDAILIPSSSIDIVQIILEADYGQRTFLGYVYSVALVSDLKKTSFNLLVQNYGSFPVLTTAKLQAQIQSVENITLRDKG